MGGISAAPSDAKGGARPRPAAEGESATSSSPPLGNLPSTSPGPAPVGLEARHTTAEPGSRLEPLAVGHTVEAVHRAWQGGVEVRLQLHPESLGDVRVRVRWEGGVLSAHLEAGTPQAQAALEGSLPELRSALQAQGIPVEHLQVGLRLDLGSPGRQPTPFQAPPPADVPLVRAGGEETDSGDTSGPARLDLRA